MPISIHNAQTYVLFFFLIFFLLFFVEISLAFYFSKVPLWVDFIGWLAPIIIHAHCIAVQCIFFVYIIIQNRWSICTYYITMDHDYGYSI